MEYLLALSNILVINIVLSGDNALVIALASRNLPERQKRLANLIGSGGAIGLRVVLSAVAVYLLRIPYLQIAGGILLIWIAVNLVSDDHQSHGEITADNHLWGAVQAIIVADAVMSLDNVIAIAGAARGNFLLIVIGLVISVPIIIWGSGLIGKLMERWPVIILIGAAILGWTAGEMFLADAKSAAAVARYPWASHVLPAVCAALVVIAGKFRSVRRQQNPDNS